MCGIAGIVNLATGEPPSLDRIASMIAPLRHRGPDESGVYLDDTVALGHLRLSIIGLNDGTQPICNEDGKLWMVYNGEAFNYIELKRDLIRKGHRFATETDTEVLLHLYEEYGTECLEKINGQFSFAIWDSLKKELFLARDRVGIRPLYYAWSAGRLLFASEIKAILAVDVARQIDLEALSQIFVFWTTLPGRTVPENFHERDLLSRAQVPEMEIFLSSFLLSSQGDRVGMAHSVEMRHPFLDFRLIDFAFRLLGKWKLKGLNEKYLLKHAFKGFIPQSITRRGKQPYRAPIRELFQPGVPADYVGDLLSEEHLRESGYFNPNKVSWLYAKFRNSGAAFASEFQNMALLGVLSTQILHQQFVKGGRLYTAGQMKPDRIILATTRR